MRRQGAPFTSGRDRTVPEALRREVSRRATELLERQFQPMLKDEHPSKLFNYAIEVFSEWRGRSFYLCTRYRTPSGKPADDFVVRSTRLQHVGNGRFDLAYFRHTNRWLTVYSGLTIQECFRTIEEEEVFWPLI